VPTRADAERLLADPAITLDVALVDLTLPDAPDGEIVDVTMAAGLPTIVFSGRFDEKLRDTLLAKGVVDYILKDNASSLACVTTLVQRVYANRNIDALVVDDSRVDMEIVARRLRLYQLNVHTASDHGTALAMLDTIPNLRLVVLDYLMPRTDGFELLRNLRARHSMHELAVIGLSGQAGPEIIARFLKSGANDFLPKSCTPEEFMLRISQNLDTLDRIQALADMAHRDALTGLSNRRHLFSQGRGIFDSARHKGAGARVASIDIDRFKSVNDTHGHEAGDALIQAFGRALAECCPPQAFPARLGGDEFCVVAARAGSCLLHPVPRRPAPQHEQSDRTRRHAEPDRPGHLEHRPQRRYRRHAGGRAPRRRHPALCSQVRRPGLRRRVLGCDRVRCRALHGISSKQAAVQVDPRTWST
jgi:PleD family two-component response regulator